MCVNWYVCARVCLCLYVCMRGSYILFGSVCLVMRVWHFHGPALQKCGVFEHGGLVFCNQAYLKELTAQPEAWQCESLISFLDHPDNVLGVQFNLLVRLFLVWRRRALCVLLARLGGTSVLSSLGRWFPRRLPLCVVVSMTLSDLRRSRRL